MSPTLHAEWWLLVHSVFSLRNKVALLLPSLVAYQGEVLRKADDSCMHARPTWHTSLYMSWQQSLYLFQLA